MEIWEFFFNLNFLSILKNRWWQKWQNWKFWKLRIFWKYLNKYRNRLHHVLVKFNFFINKQLLIFVFWPCVFFCISALSHPHQHSVQSPYPAHYDGNVNKTSNGPVVLRRKKKQTSANLGKCFLRDYFYFPCWSWFSAVLIFIFD